VFNRGVTGADLFPDLDHRVGDRATGDYGSVSGTDWDAVVDVSGYVPRHVREAAGALGKVGRYLFISTGSVYDIAKAVGEIDEDSPRLAPEHSTEEITNTTYGPLKVACEDVLVEHYGAAATIVRPGIVAGPYDPTDRFTWWVRRATVGGSVTLARPDQPVQVVDVHDLAALVQALLHADRDGVYNAVGPAEPTTISGLAHACAEAAGTTLEVVADPAAAEGTEPPLVLTDPADDPAFERSAARARAAGMPSTALADTAAQVLAWDRERGLPPLTAGPPIG
jgi:2'-hydroxyisoflavone reductase